MSTTDEKNRFLKWIAKAASFSAAPAIYASLLELDFYFRKRGTLKKSLFETHDVLTLKKIQTAVGFDRDFRDAYRDKTRDMLSAVQYYAYYVRSMGLEEPIPDTEEAGEDATEAAAEEEAKENAGNYVPHRKTKRHRVEGQYYDWLARLDRGGKRKKE